MTVPPPTPELLATPVAFRRPRFAWRCGNRILALGTRTHLAGILNITPDSFSDGGSAPTVEAALRRAETMLQDGADLIDVGGESTRPGANPVDLATELSRVIPVIRELSRALRCVMAVDTSKAEVARQAIEAGAHIINDVTALRGDPGMADVAARLQVPVILMHMQGTPQTMQAAPHYDDVVAEVRSALEQAAQRGTSAGIPADYQAVDPGIGFGKTLPQNLALLRHLDALHALGRPIMVGVSRKALIGEVLQAPVGERLMGTAALCALAITQGAHLLRIHDVKPIAEVARMIDAVIAAPAPPSVSP
ncbi:MAG: dihydropteroate synthase [Candidatus Omnitrophica bacterium]|nr:dihydropteroate synthase [Candidatus Omnitrophota bacterium]